MYNRRFNQESAPQEIDYKTQVSRNKIPGAHVFSGYGERDIASAAKEDIWPGPSAQQPIPPATGIQMEIVSSSAADSYALGTGTEELEIHYLDANGVQKSERIEMDGTNPVNTIATDIMFVECTHVWSGLECVGNISVLDTTGTTTYAYLPATSSRCASSLRMVPAGKTLYITAAVGGSASGASKRAIIRIETNSIMGEIVSGGIVHFPQGTIVTQDNSVYGTFDPPLPVPEFSIVKGEAETTGASFVSFSFFGWIEDN